MGAFALAAIGRDRPGIVAAVSKVLYEHGCNVEDSSMTLLRGNFAMMLVGASPQNLTADELRAALRSPCEELGLTFSVLPVTERPDIPHPSHILTVYGADRLGILYRVSQTLADTGVNITDLNSRLVGGTDNPVYALMLELGLPEGTDVSRVRSALERVGAEVGVDFTLRELEDDIL